MSVTVEQPLVLLHGFLGSTRSWDDAPFEESRCIVPELFGHGLLPPTKPTTDFFSECNRLLRLAPVGSRLVAYSMGARMALGMLTVAPLHFSSVTLVGVNPGLREEAQRAERRALEQSWCVHIATHGLESFVDEWERLPLFESQMMLDTERFERQRAIRTSHFSEGVVGAIEGLGLSTMPNLWPRLSDVKVPVALVCGQSDSKFVEISQRIREFVPEARLEIIEDCGHNPVLERPERFWASI